MEVILREHVDNLGKRGEVVKVADGYARNYLLPRKLALLATEGNKKQIERERAKFEAKEADEKRVADAMASRLNSVEVVIARKVGETDALYGSVTSADIAEALATPELAAASNWHALASFACRFLPERTGLLIDIGSTTTDIIPLVQGRVAALGCNDMQRLVSRELVYRGVGRTPICAMMSTLPVNRKSCPTAAEVFATAADAYVLTGDLIEDLDQALL